MRRIAAIVTACCTVLPLAACDSTSGSSLVSNSGPAPAAYYGLVDYQWLPPVSNFVASRLQSDLRRVPPLLQQGCQLSDSARKEQGEDFATHVVAEAALLRLAERDPAAVAEAVPGAVGAGPPGGGRASQMADPAGTYAACLDNWARGWRTGRPDTRRGWADVISEVDAVPPFSGTPGSTKVPGCRGAGDGNWDVQMALLIRVWGIAADVPAPDLPKPVSQLAQDFAARAWLQGGAADEDHVICDGHIPESENHELLIRTTKFLHNELLPMVDAASVNHNDAVGRYDVNTNADNTTNGIGTILYGAMREWVDHDFLEYNSRPYGRYQMIGLLNLYDFASSPQTRNAAEAPLDFLSAKHAAESMDRLRIAPFRRRGDHYNDDLATGDTVAPMYAVWVGGLSLPPFIAGAGGEMALAASSDYRPPDVLIDRMLNPAHRGFLEQFNGRGQEEAGYGAPDFTITGGGRETACPYGAFGTCIGDGNDFGAVVPIVVIPHRSRQPGDQPSADPLTDGLVSIVSYDDAQEQALRGTSWAQPPEPTRDSCLYRNFACGPYAVLGAPVTRTPGCSDAGKDPLGNPYAELRFDGSCAGPAYAGDCFFVYKLQMREPDDELHPPLSYVVTHSCDPAWPDGAIRDAFAGFGQYMRTIGAPDYLHGCPSHGIVPDPGCSFDVQVTLPAETSLEPGEVVDARFSDTGNAYWLGSPAPPPNASLAGDLVSFGPQRGDRRQLVFRDPAAGETMYSFDDGGSPLGVAAPTAFSWRASLSSNGRVRVEVTAADQAEEIRRITLAVTDAAPLPGCTLSNGLQGCPTNLCPPGLCANPPPRQQTAQVYDQVFGYGELPLANGQPFLIDGTPTPITPGDPYIVRACLTWYAYFTPADNRSPGAGPDGQESCDTTRIEASAITGSPFAPFSPTRLTPIRHGTGP
jgi:hypothetical protein